MTERQWTQEEIDDGCAEDDGLCFDCGEPSEMCECHIGDDCGRWRDGRLSLTLTFTSACG